MDFVIPADHKVELKESEKKGKYLDLARELQKLWNMGLERLVSHQKIGTRTGELGNKRTSRNDPNYSTIEIGQNTEESPEDLRRIVVTQSPVKDHQLKLMRKISEE